MATKLGLGEKGLLLGIIIYFVDKFFGCTLAAICFIACIVALIYSIYHIQGQWKRLGMPGPSPIFLLGNALEAFGQGLHVIDPKWTKQYGKVFGYYLMTSPEVVVSDVDLLKQILVKDFNNFTNRREITGSLMEENSIFCKAVIMTKDDEWKNIRTTITPAFTSGKMKNMTPLVDDCVDTLMQILTEKAEANEEFNAKEIFGACAMDVIASVAFGQKIDSQRNPNSLFVKYAKDIQSISIKSFGFMFSVLFPWITHQMAVRFNIKLVVPAADNFFTNNLTRLVSERRKNPVVTDKPDFLQLLLNAAESKDDEEPKDELITHDNMNVKRIPLTTMQIISQSFLFIIGGYETTANALTMVSYLMALNPEKQEICFEEIKSVAGNEHINYNHIQRTPYLDAAIAETLRIFPPLPRIDRTCKEDYNLGGIIIPKNTNVSAAVYVMHHDEENYPEPERFLPERFLPEEKANRNPILYLPFGYGPRNCIGMRFAQMEMKLILANIIRKFKILPTDKLVAYPPKFNTDTGMMVPVKPFILRLEARKN